LFAILAATVLFLYGLEEFSAEIRRVGGDALTEWLGNLTKTRWGYSRRHCDGNRSIEQRGLRGRWRWSMLERFL
jgi:hypothetical protein